MDAFVSTAPESVQQARAVQRALRWLTDRLRTDRTQGFQLLVVEAALRFELTPLEVEYLRTGRITVH